MISCGKLDLEQTNSKNNGQPTARTPFRATPFVSPSSQKMPNHSKVIVSTLIYTYYDYFYPGAMLCGCPQHH